MMETLLPMFPLQIVVYPGDILPLHIFEERYRQLVDDCEAGDPSFGIPTFLNNKLEYGSKVILDRVVKKYPNGTSDIICRGIRVFNIDEFVNPYPEKMYAGARVTYLKDLPDGVPSLYERLRGLILRLYEELGVDEEVDEEFTSYTYAHKVGLSVEQEYELLTLRSESDRLKFMLNHIENVLPMIRELNRTKALIQMNGHFRNYDPLDFKELRNE